MTSSKEPVAEPFFEPLPEPQRAEDQVPVYVQMPWQPPINIVPVSPGGTVELARTHDTVAVLCGLEVYPTGLALTVHTWQRPGTENRDAGHWWHELRIGLLLEDGTKIGAVADEGLPDDINAVPATPRLAGLGGSGGGIHQSGQHWLYPIPTGNRWTFVIEWLARGIPETRVTFDARHVHEAAAASSGELWDLPKPPEGTEYGWFGFAG